MKVRFLYKFLFIDNQKEILFPFGIRGLIQLDDVVLIFIYGDTPDELKNLPTNNIYAFDKNAKQIWQIEEPPQAEGRVVSFADISLRNNGEVVAGTTIGTEYTVNIENGSITPRTGQRPW